MSDLLATVAAIYEAFGRGDIPAIKETLAPDIAWEAWADNFAQRAGIPWLVPCNTPDEVAGFFGIVAQFRIADFQVVSLMVGGNQVAAEIVIEATIPNGGRYRDEELHLWTFNEHGKVSRFRHYVDTAKHIAAASGQDTLIRQE